MHVWVLLYPTCKRIPYKYKFDFACQGLALSTRKPDNNDPPTYES